MVVAVEALPELIQKQWNLVSVGGGPVREIVDGTRRANLFNIKSMILSLGVDKRVYSHSQNRWERVASEFVDFTRAEAMNNDFKDLLGTRPTSEELRAFLAVHGYSDDVKVVEGCPSRPDDPRLEQMMSVSPTFTSTSPTAISASLAGLPSVTWVTMTCLPTSFGIPIFVYMREKQAIPIRKFMTTPAMMTSALCQAGFAKNI